MGSLWAHTGAIGYIVFNTLFSILFSSRNDITVYLIPITVSVQVPAHNITHFGATCTCTLHMYHTYMYMYMYVYSVSHLDHACTCTCVYT